MALQTQLVSLLYVLCCSVIVGVEIVIIPNEVNDTSFSYDEKRENLKALHFMTDLSLVVQKAKVWPNVFIHFCFPGTSRITNWFILTFYV